MKKINLKKLMVGLVCLTVALIAFLGVAVQAAPIEENGKKTASLTAKLLAEKYGATNIESYTIDDFVPKKYSELTGPQKVIYRKLQNYEWYGATFIDKKGEFVTLVDYFKSYGINKVGDFVDYPSIFFDGNKFYYTVGDYLDESVWDFDGVTTDIKVPYRTENGKDSYVTIKFDELTEDLYVSDPDEWSPSYHAIYYKNKGKDKEVVTKKVIGKWMDMCYLVDGKVVSFADYAKNITFGTDENVEDFNVEFFADGTSRVNHGKDVLANGTYKIDDEGYIINTDERGTVTFYYDEDYDMLVLMPKSLDDNHSAYIGRLNNKEVRPVTNADFAGHWWVDVDSTGADYNTYAYYVNIKKYFGLEMYGLNTGYDYCFNEDGTGYYMAHHDSEKETFTYTTVPLLDDGVRVMIKVVYDDSKFEENYFYDIRIDNIMYMNSTPSIKDESLFFKLRRKTPEDMLNANLSVNEFALKYGATDIHDYVLADAIPEKYLIYTDLTDEQKKVYDYLQDKEWYGATFVSDDKLITLNQYYKKLDIKSNGRFIDYPSLYFSGFKFIYTCGDYAEETVWKFDGDTTTIHVVYDSNGEKIYGIIDVDPDKNLLYVTEPKEWSGVEAIYYKTENNERGITADKIVGLWLDVNNNTNGKVVKIYDYMKEYEGKNRISNEVGGEITEVYHEFTADGKVKNYANGKLVSEGEYLIDDDGYIYTNGAYGKMLCSYDAEYDVIVTMANELENDHFTIMERINTTERRPAEKKDLVGKWWVDWSSYGQDYNRIDYYREMDKRFGTNYAHIYNGFELNFNEDGTGYYKNDEQENADEFTYEIKDDGITVEVTYKDNSKERYLYDTRIGKLGYINGSGEPDESAFAIYKRKDKIAE